MERRGGGRDERECDACCLWHKEASMEPLAEERNHGPDIREARRLGILASMEPLAEERNHRLASMPCGTYQQGPQWSRSLRSGITAAIIRTRDSPTVASMEPLAEERNHLERPVNDPRAALRPQWSRSLRSGITCIVFGDGAQFREASMEPLAEGRTHP